MFFRDPEEQPIDLIHQIKLYPASPEGLDQKSLGAPPQQNSKKPVVSEQYDEAVFTDPTESFKRLLMLYSTFSVDSRAADASGMVRPMVHLSLYFISSYASFEQSLPVPVPLDIYHLGELRTCD